MKRIILFRHGKSEWKPGIADFDRDLKPKGIKRTKKSAKELAKISDLSIDAWYSSPARRAEKTAIITSKFFKPKPEIRLNHDLYGLDCRDLISFVKGFDNSFQTIIIFGHNEAFTEFVNRMGDQEIENLPTSGVAILDFDVSNWLAIGKGKTVRVIIPKEL